MDGFKVGETVYFRDIGKMAYTYPVGHHKFPSGATVKLGEEWWDVPLQAGVIRAFDSGWRYPRYYVSYWKNEENHEGWFDAANLMRDPSYRYPNKAADVRTQKPTFESKLKYQLSKALTFERLANTGAARGIVDALRDAERVLGGPCDLIREEYDYRISTLTLTWQRTS